MINTSRRKVVLDLKGKRFGRWTVLKLDEEKTEKVRWICECDCGSVKSVLRCSLRSGRSISCGCHRKEFLSELKKGHGLTNTRLHNIWGNMKSRCNDREDDRYGGRGIKVCQEWENDFLSFFNWSLKNGYKENLTIDRIDNDGDYKPSNCRWVTREVQNNNTSLNVVVEVNGEVLTLAEISKKYNIGYSAIHHRYRSGKRGIDLIREPRGKLIIRHQGKEMNLKEWSRELGFSYSTLQHRYNKGLRGDDLFGPINETASINANAARQRSVGE